MRLEEKTTNQIKQYTNALDFSEEALILRTKEYLDKFPKELYKSDIVAKDRRNATRKDGYSTTDTKKRFCEVISNVLFKSSVNIEEDSQCTYNSGRRVEKIKNLCIPDFNEYIINKSDKYSETKLVHCLCKQKTINGFEAVDFQVPTTNGGSDKIDLMLKKDTNVYMVEVKTFNSDESILRCVLEIETYYQKLNNRFFEKYCPNHETLHKAILIDEKSWAFSQINQDWSQKLLKNFNISVLVLDEESGKFVIKEA